MKICRRVVGVWYPIFEFVMSQLSNIKQAKCHAAKFVSIHPRASIVSSIYHMTLWCIELSIDYDESWP